MQRSEIRPFHVENKCGGPDAERGLPCLKNREKASRKEEGRGERWLRGRQEGCPQHWLCGPGKRLDFILRTMGALGGFQVGW